MHTGSAQGIDAHSDVRAAYHVHVHDGAEVAHIGLQVVVSVGRGGTPRRGVLHSVDGPGARSQQIVRPGLDPLRHVGVRGSAVRRVVFEAPVIGRIVRGRNDDAVGEAALAAAGIGEGGGGN